jgi:hypothetical protein
MLFRKSADVVFSSDTYHHFEYPFKMLASISKTLRPNSKFVIIDFKDKSSHVRADSKTVIKDLTVWVRTGLLREDLYYRVNMV